MTKKPYRVWIDSSPVFGPTSGHWGPMFTDIEEWKAWSCTQHLRQGIVLILFQGECEVARQTVKGKEHA